MSSRRGRPPGGLYAIDIWRPFLAKSNLQLIEVANKRASRVITGTPTDTPSSATLTDARLRPIYQEIEDRAAMLWDRYRRYPEEHHLHNLTRPRLRSRGEQSFRQDWPTMARRRLDQIRRGIVFEYLVAQRKDKSNTITRTPPSSQLTAKPREADRWSSQ